MASICIHFSDFFNIESSLLKEYGAFDVSLVADVPVFIDPFCLYASDKEKYNELHTYIIKYLCFLREKCERGPELCKGDIDRYFRFPEVRQLYMGFSKKSNKGHGLGPEFAETLQRNFRGPLSKFGSEDIQDSSHLEKLCVVSPGVGCDCISDFTANLLLDFLMTYTEDFARKNLKPEQCEIFGVAKAIFDFKKQDWRRKSYYLPKYNGSYVLLAPIDILARGDTWINRQGLIEDISRLPQIISNDALRQRLQEMLLSVNYGFKKKSQKERTQIYNRFIQENIEIVDWYIKERESRKDDALNRAQSLIFDTQDVFSKETHRAAECLDREGFYDTELTSIDEARARIGHFQRFIEHNDGYKLFFDSNGKQRREEYVQLAFKLLWYASKRDANREVNNGQGPADLVISFGNGDKCVIEIKWASNNRLEENLICQTEKYARANGTNDKLSIVLYKSRSERNKVEDAIRKHNLIPNKDVFLIDATPNRKSASRLGFEDISLEPLEFPTFDL